MIRNVVLGKVHLGSDAALLDEGLARISQLQVDGMLSIAAGRDAGLREGNWDYVITADFVDAAAYRRYDLDEEHNRLRREFFAVVSAEIARAQFAY
ncbi:Dabb family protein [Motilibacter deserti]|uniref:Dabb family protein n=1 Tax=Motilibacter deserti TaxID=2714956 RepID=A0ABX0GXZ6_9ACTN|nr:Dabb family protein [Motilibacter deserti]NHC14103.1 Dabb family protein [Motilibacter deserti]